MSVNNVSQAEEKCDTWMSVWGFQQSVRDIKDELGVRKASGWQFFFYVPYDKIDKVYGRNV